MLWKTVFQKHMKSSLAFAQACQTTYSEMPCAYYIISRSTKSDGMSPKLQCLPGFETLTPFSSVEDHPHEGATDIVSAEFPLVSNSLPKFLLRPVDSVVLLFLEPKTHTESQNYTGLLFFSKIYICYVYECFVCMNI